MTLRAPGVEVQVIDESFYTPGAPATTPIIFIVSAENKINPSGVIASATLASEAGRIQTITSQRDLVDKFGTPTFYTDSIGNSLHGDELNEYGLQAAYSLLGVSSRAYIVRANLDLAKLQPLTSEPEGSPVSGSYWIDMSSTRFGINEWDSTNSVFVVKDPLIIDNTNAETFLNPSSNEPKASIGNVGSYAAVVTSDNENTIWFKNSNAVWVKVGSNFEANFLTSSPGSTFVSTAWQTSWPLVSTVNPAPDETDQFLINGITVTCDGVNPNATSIAANINALLMEHGVGAKAVGNTLQIYADASAKSNGVNADGKVTFAEVPGGDVLEKLGLVPATVYGPVALTIAPHTRYPQYGSENAANGSVYIKTTEPNNGARWTIKLYNGITQSWSTVVTPIYDNPDFAIYAIDRTGGRNIAAGTLYIESNYGHGAGNSALSSQLANFKVWRRNSLGPTRISSRVPASYAITSSVLEIRESLANSPTLGSTATVTISAASTIDEFVSAINANTTLVNVSATYDSINEIVTISHNLGGNIYFNQASGTVLDDIGFSAYDVALRTGTENLYSLSEFETYDLIATNWKPLVYEARSTEPTTEPAEGTLWYSAVRDEVDIMIHNGSTWVGYLNYYPNSDPNGPQVRASAPTKQSDGVSDLVDGDIWISSADLENYGNLVYIWDNIAKRWIEQDVTDNTSPNGWVFADARWATSGSATEPSQITDLLTSNYLDPDAPDPVLYPQGTKLWNLRRSGFNVKEYRSSYIDSTETNPRFNDQAMSNYNVARWVTVSSNDPSGRGSFGRKAQRQYIVERLKSEIDTNQSIRNIDTIDANLLVCPGYVEVVGNLCSLNIDRKETGFVIGDTPFRLPADSTSLSDWGFNNAGALNDGENGLLTKNNNLAIFYPSGFTNDNTGKNIVVPPSHMMIRTIVNSDQRSYLWFAPAGIRRGTIDNATSVGYVSNGEFVPVALNEGVRGVMQDVQINPLVNFTGTGLLNFGNYTRATAASALDRINVSRLVAYLRRQLDILARPFLFEPNDRTTRNEIKNAVDSFLLELVGQRALYDYITICDEFNNTPERIDRNELWVDIAVEPVKAIEYIYIPLRLKNTGDIQAGL
jgi:hypothetical protein